MSRRANIETLIDRIANGDRRAFAQLYDVTSGRLYALVLALVGAADGPAVLAQCYVKIWAAAGRFRASDLAGMTWLIMTARDVAIAKRGAMCSVDWSLGAGPMARALATENDDFRAAFFAAFEGRAGGACFEDGLDDLQRALAE